MYPLACASRIARPSLPGALRRLGIVAQKASRDLASLRRSKGMGRMSQRPQSGGQASQAQWAWRSCGNGSKASPLRHQSGDGDVVSSYIVGPVDAGRRRDFKIESRQCEVPRFTRTQHQPVRSKDHGVAIAIGGGVCDRDRSHAADLSRLTARARPTFADAFGHCRAPCCRAFAFCTDALAEPFAPKRSITTQAEPQLRHIAKRAVGIINQDVVDFCLHLFLAFIWSQKLRFRHHSETVEVRDRHGIPSFSAS